MLVVQRIIDNDDGIASPLGLFKLMSQIGIRIDLADIIVGAGWIGVEHFAVLYSVGVLLIRSTGTLRISEGVSGTCAASGTRCGFVANDKDYCRGCVNLFVKFFLEVTGAAVGVLRNTTGFHCGHVYKVNYMPVIGSPVVEDFDNSTVSVILRIICANVDAFAHWLTSG